MHPKFLEKLAADFLADVTKGVEGQKLAAERMVRGLDEQQRNEVAKLVQQKVGIKVQ